MHAGGTNNVQKVRTQLELRDWVVFCNRYGLSKAYMPLALLRRPICNHAWKEPLKHDDGYAALSRSTLAVEEFL